MRLFSCPSLPRMRTWAPTLGACVGYLASLFATVPVVQGQEMSFVTQEHRSSARAATESPSTASSRQKGALITSVQVFPDRVELTLSAPVAFRRASLRGAAGAQLPDRYYVDLFPATLARQLPSVFNVVNGPVQRVRLSQFRAGMVRVVLDLRGSHEGQMTVLSDPLRLVISVDETVATPDSPPTEQGQAQGSVEKSMPTDVRARDNLFPQQQSSRSREPLATLTWRAITQPWAMTPYSQAVSDPLTLSTAARAFAPQVGERSQSPGAPVVPQFVLPQLPGETRMRAADVAPFLVAPVLASSPPSPPEASFGDGVMFFTPWSWERLCQEAGCMRVGAEVPPTLVREPIQLVSAAIVHADAPQDFNLVNEEGNLAGINYVGGVTMHQVWFVVMSVGVLLSFLAGLGVMVVWNRRQTGARTEKSDGWETRMAYLEEAVNRAGVLNSSFFHALEVTQKRLETLLSQADLSEQSLRRLIHQATFVGEKPAGRDEVAVPVGGGRPDAFATAARLLAEGEDVQHVARSLKLPVAQVRLLQEIRQLTQLDTQEKTAGPREETTAPQNTTASIVRLEDVLVQLNETGRNGMRFAHKGQAL